MLNALERANVRSHLTRANGVIHGKEKTVAAFIKAATVFSDEPRGPAD
jgi:hypothetical protein